MAEVDRMAAQLQALASRDWVSRRCAANSYDARLDRQPTGSYLVDTSYGHPRSVQPGRATAVHRMTARANRTNRSDWQAARPSQRR